MKLATKLLRKIKDMTYTVKNKQHEQDNISFIDVTSAKEELPSFLDYKKVLEHSLKSKNITSEKDIKSLCDGGDHLEPYFSENTAAYECAMYVEYTPFVTIDDEGKEFEQTLDFDSETEEYELF